MSSQPDVKPRLHQSHEADFCSTLLNSLDAIIWEADATTFQFQFVSHQAERILGYPAEQWITQPDFWRQHTHPDDVEWCSAFCRDSTARGTDHVFEYRMISADHRVVWLRDVVTIVRGAEERPLLRGLMLDITEHKQAEEQLRKSEERFRTLANHVREVFWISALGGTEMLYVSPAYESIWGMSCDSLYQNPRSFLDPIVPEDRERTLKACESGRERDFEVEFRIRKPDGSVRWIRDRGFPLRDRSGQVYAVGGLAEDVTERKKIEERLTRIRTAVDGTSDGIVIADPPGTSLHHNPAFVAMTGFDVEAINRVGGFPCILADPAIAAQIRARDQQGESWQGEVALRARNNRTKFVYLTRDCIRDDNHRVIGVVSVCNDLTERREMERQFRQAQKMEAIGRLAGGIAHDFNNLLNVISGYGELALLRVQPSDALVRYLEGIKQAVERGGALTRHLLAFSRQQMLEPAVLNINNVVEDMSDMLRRVIGPDIEFVTILAPGLVRVKADRSELEHLIMNLVVNARDAMPRGGKLEIQTKNATITEESSIVSPQPAAPGDYAMLLIRDSGIGIEASTLQKIFEPFFTTKEFGKGTGLGLSIVYGIVQQSGGFITVESELGKGATFQVYLPQTSAPLSSATTVEEPVKAENGGRETILLVEDEYALRDLTREALASEGYCVIEVANGNEALAACDKHAGVIHLMITDVIMPKMRGDDLARHISTRHPEMHVLFTSGYTATSLDEEFSHVNFMQKPFRLRDLVERVRHILNQPHHSTKH